MLFDQTKLFNGSFEYTDRGDPCFKHKIPTKRFAVIIGKTPQHADIIDGFSSQPTAAKAVARVRNKISEE